MAATASLLVALAATAGNLGPDRKAWVHLLPGTGLIEARDGRSWTMSDPARVVAMSMGFAQGVPIPIDYDHQAENTAKNGQPAPAAGWISQLEARPDGIWGLVEWTPKAAAHLAAKEYRFISPTFAHTQPKQGKPGEVTAILRAGLTNTPALSTLTALASQKDTMDPDLIAALEGLRTLLGLSADAKPDAIYEAVRSLKESGSSAASAGLVPIALLEKATAEIRRLDGNRMSLEAATIMVGDDIRTARLLPFMKDWALALCQENRKAYDDFVGKTSVGLQEVFAPRQRTAFKSTEPALDTDIARNLGLAE